MDTALEVTTLRKSTGMNRKEFCEYFQIPYSTVTDWELGHREMPEYLFRLMEYRLRMEKLMKQTKEKEAEQKKQS